MRAGLEAVVRSNTGLEFIRAFSLDDMETCADEFGSDVMLLELTRFDDEWVALLAGLTIPIVLLTAAPDAAMFRAGIRAILSSDATAAEIEAAITSAAIGLITVQQFALELLSADTRPALAALEESLTPREREVLALLAEGLSNKVLAYKLSISEHTVKFHITSIMGKLGASSRTDAVMQGIRRGLILI